ncbi:MAG: phenylalanine 4-monooxygenase [Rhodothermales bacterium]
MNELHAETTATEDAPLSAYERAAEEVGDPRCIPQYLEEAPPVGSDIATPVYSDEHNQNWRYLFNRQMQLLPGRAGQSYMNGVRLLGMDDTGVPALRDLSTRMEAATGWRIARIPGLLHEKYFFKLLSERIFPSTDYIREKHELDYTPAPDCFHDMFGHMPMLTEPAVAYFYHLFGKTALNATGIQRTWLERLHWFTVEFGLIRQAEGLRIFGAGIISSKNEVTLALSDAVDVRDFSMEAVINQDYAVWHLQPRLFALESFEQLEDAFRHWTKKEGLSI